ncbi:hypothetical protein ACQ4PT_035366 [Festuca glaucescens]
MVLWKGYDTWLFHGESSSSFLDHDGAQVENSPANDEFSDLLLDIACGLDDGGNLEMNSEDNEMEVDDETKAYLKLVDDNSLEIYPGCKKKIQNCVLLLDYYISNLLGGGVTKVLTCCLSYKEIFYLKGR